MSIGFLGDPVENAVSAAISESFVAGVRDSNARHERAAERREAKEQREAIAAARFVEAERDAAKQAKLKLMQTRFDAANDQMVAARTGLTSTIDRYQKIAEDPQWDDVTRKQAKSYVESAQGKLGSLDTWRMKAIQDIYSTGGEYQPQLPTGFLSYATLNTQETPEAKKTRDLKVEMDQAQLDHQRLATHDLRTKMGLFGQAKPEDADKENTTLFTSLAEFGGAVEGLRSANATYTSAHSASSAMTDGLAGEQETYIAARLAEVQPHIAKAGQSWLKTLGLMQSGVLRNVLPGSDRVTARAQNELGDITSIEAGRRFFDYVNGIAQTPGDPDAGAARAVAGALLPYKPHLDDLEKYGSYYRQKTTVKGTTQQ